MIEKKQRKVLELTQRIVNEYWAGNQELLLRYVHPNILWIGSTNSEYIHGAKEMQKRLLENKTAMPMVYLDEQEYEIVYSDTKSCLVAGRYRAYTRPDSGLVLSERQRVSFLWVKDKVGDFDRVRIKHIHLSNVLKIQGEDEYFPVREGRKNYETLKKVVSERALGQSMTVKDIHQITKVFNYTEIAYLRADRNYTEFFSNGGICVARVRENLSKFSENLPESFLQVSRSILVNRDFVQSINGRNLTMLDDSVIQVPAARCARIRKEIYENLSPLKNNS